MIWHEQCFMQTSYLHLPNFHLFEAVMLDIDNMEYLSGYCFVFGECEYREEMIANWHGWPSKEGIENSKALVLKQES